MVRTGRLTGAAALLVTLILPVPAYAQRDGCPQPGLGPPIPCVAPGDGGTTTTTPAPDQPVKADPGPALWVGAVFGLSGLAGLAYATARVREPGADEGP